MEELEITPLKVAQLCAAVLACIAVTSVVCVAIIAGLTALQNFVGAHLARIFRIRSAPEKSPSAQ
jgi:hypothetical protein